MDLSALAKARSGRDVSGLTEANVELTLCEFCRPLTCPPDFLQSELEPGGFVAHERG